MSGIIGKNASRSSGVIGTAAGGIASLAADSSPQLGGFLDAAGNYIQMEKGGDISSASPTVIDTDGDYFDVTGTTNFAAFTVAADRHFFIQFDGVLTMTHHATNLDLPGGANITTAAGDVAEFFSTGANTVQCVNYTKADGTAVVVAAGGLTTQVVESTYNTATSSGTADYTGAGFDPTAALLIAVENSTTEWSFGWVDSGGDNSCIINIHSIGATQWRGDSGNAVEMHHVENHDVQGVLSLISDGVRITWTKTGSPTGTAQIYLFCMK